MLRQKLLTAESSSALCLCFSSPKVIITSLLICTLLSAPITNFSYGARVRGFLVWFLQGHLGSSFSFNLFSLQINPFIYSGTHCPCVCGTVFLLGLLCCHFWKCLCLPPRSAHGPWEWIIASLFLCFFSINLVVCRVLRIFSSTGLAGFTTSDLRQSPRLWTNFHLAKGHLLKHFIKSKNSELAILQNFWMKWSSSISFNPLPSYCTAAPGRRWDRTVYLLQWPLANVSKHKTQSSVERWLWGNFLSVI